MPKGHRSAFALKSLPVGDDGRLRSHIIATCSKCEDEGSILIAKHNGNVPAEVGAKMFRRLGWSMGSNRAKDECPTCLSMDRYCALPVGKQDVIDYVAITDGLDAAESLLIDSTADPETVEALVLAEVEEEAQRHKSKRVRRRERNEARNPVVQPDTVVTPPEAVVAVGDTTDAPQDEDRSPGWQVRRYWARMSPEERSARNSRVHAARRANKLARGAPFDPPGPVPSPPLLSPAPDSLPTPQPCTEEDVMTPPKLTVVEPTTAPRADDPALRQPTVVQNRAIRDALDIHYDEERQTYKGEMTDRQLAEQLNVPAAWVGQIRGQLYGPDRNEADDKLRVEFQALSDRQDAVERKVAAALDTISEADVEINAIKKRLEVIAAALRLPRAS